MLAADGDYRFICDVDLSMPIEEVIKFLSAAASGYNINIATREGKGAKRVGEPEYRHLMGRINNLIIKITALPDFEDTQCGFKAFRRSAAQVIFRLQTIERWGFDPEILFIAQKLGYEIREVPVTWGHDERSRLSYLRDGMKMLEEMAIIRSNSLAGRYDKAIAEIRDTTSMVTHPVRLTPPVVAHTTPDSGATK